MANGQPIPSLLTDSQRAECNRIAGEGRTLHSRRASALLLIDSGFTQREAGTKTGLRIAQVRYVLNRFRKLGLAIFPPPGQENKAIEQKTAPTEVKTMPKETKKEKKQKDKKSKKEKDKKKEKGSKKKKGKKKKDKKKKK